MDTDGEGSCNTVTQICSGVRSCKRFIATTRCSNY